LLLHATVEELVRHDLALRENADDGRYLVFPSQFDRDYEDAPEPKGKAVAITFDGPVQSLYSTLAESLRRLARFAAAVYVQRMIDWRQCSAVERVPGKVSGAWVFTGTRVPVRALFENLEGGARVEEFLEWFPGVTRGQVLAVLKYAESTLVEAVA
jgi:uncharacterized protein (DUF433 family)